jgi:hypothetical protein
MKSADQIQQNFITPTNHKKNWGVIFVGNFRIWDKINKTRLENEEGRLRNRDQRGSDTKMM